MITVIHNNTTIGNAWCDHCNKDLAGSYHVIKAQGIAWCKDCVYRDSALLVSAKVVDEDWLKHLTMKDHYVWWTGISTSIVAKIKTIPKKKKMPRTLSDVDAKKVQNRLPSCVLAAKTHQAVIRLLSLNEKLSKIRNMKDGPSYEAVCQSLARIDNVRKSHDQK